MDLKYKFNAREYSAIVGITPSALRKRRLSGKLNGSFIKKGSEFFYASPAIDGPNKDTFTPINSRSKHRSRHVPRSEVQYHRARNGHQLQQANDIKQLCRINRSLSEDGIAEIVPDIIEVAKQRRVERLKKNEEKLQRDINPTYYGGFINCKNKGYKDIDTGFKPIFEQETEDQEPINTKRYY